jgi:hypothetical protein
MFPDDLLSGDVILTADQTWLSRAIRTFEKMQTGHANYSHAAVSIGDGLCIEALWRTRINDLKKYERQTYQAWRLPLTDAERKNFAVGMMQLAGNNYGITKIPLFALDGMATQVTRIFGRQKPVFWFTRKIGVFNIPVCSQLVAYGLEKFTSYRILDIDGNHVPWRTISPDYFQDLLVLSHNKAKTIYEQVIE